jgi:hypothetical protein
LERTLVLAHTVSPEGARKVLLGNAEVAREIDIEEADFVLFGNEVRMLMGTIAWSVDPLVCACTRDHSSDRKAGKASGHISTLPGKASFTDRLKRFGADGSSEGAGGGSSGRGYINGLSYGGGHTGPLYSLKRNVVGVGRRGGVYTSVYSTDRQLIHPCQVTDGELFMPPGICGKEITSPAVLAAHQSISRGQYGAAQKLISRALNEGETAQRSVAALALGTSVKPQNSARDKVLFRFFEAAIQVEADWRIAELNALDGIGDMYEVKCRVDRALKDFDGVPGFSDRITPLVERLKEKDIVQEIKAGAVYHHAAAAGTADTLLRSMMLFAQQCKGSVYAQAAQQYLAAPADKTPFSFFTEKSSLIKRYGYPPDNGHAKK